MSDDIKVIVTGDDEIMEMLRKLSPSALLPAMHRIGVRLRTAMAKYPPPPPNSTYRRTGKLGRSWTYRTSANLIKAETIVGNNTPYAPDVQGEGYQKPIHVGRWQTDEEVLEANTDWIMEEIEEEIDSVMED